ncbi:hypothetical protein HHK36_022256 [Tetracentron sinense]|uniref:Protein kinase domain-containing protein n=1 Tax=Tetracentron sinense TaxID=13715 RepID=A0A834YRL0_TETSI|nr:hypothetical protein HHK36_022256 [Tetracentron sinense]
MGSCFRIHKEREEEERNFLENGGLLLEELITSFNGRSNPFRLFSKQELKRATKNYHQDGLLHQDGLHKWYKGTYEDRAISVKKLIVGYAPQKDIGWCINEVVVASHMNNHKNVLKLLGCCLETQAPTLVFEFAANGCLSYHIFEEELSPSYLSWESRLRIATEIADAVAYLHNGTSKLIVHRAINSYTILLDEHYVAKLFEFRLSISIPLGQTHVDGNLSSWYIGSIAPESNGTWRFTEKSDVYSYGVVLFEILTGKRVLNILKEIYGVVESSSWQVNRSFILADDNENDIRVYLRANIVKGNTEQLMACAELAIRCVKVNPEERPSMIEAAKELRRISRFQHDSL